MDGQVDENRSKAERSAPYDRPRRTRRKRLAYEDSFIGKEVEVLLEEQQRRIAGKGCYDRTYKRVYENCTRNRKKSFHNCIVKVRIENHSQIIR